MTRPYQDIFYRSSDGLNLYARNYPGAASKTTLLCLHGLSRNSADFHGLLDALPGFAAISPDQRGRGKSDYDADPVNYRPEVYCGDMFKLLKTQNLRQIIAVGTSMGGLMTMMMAAADPGIFKAAIINDIGPEIDPSGLARLRGYVGQSGAFDSWQDAASTIRAQGPEIFPEFTDKDWLEFAKRTSVKTEDGKVRFAYDPAISSGISADNPTVVPPDLWPVFDSLASIPLLIIRGETSDILSAETAAKMLARHPDSRLTTVPKRGHAPLLTEPSAVLAIQEFLKAYT